MRSIAIFSRRRAGGPMEFQIRVRSRVRNRLNEFSSGCVRVCMIGALVREDRLSREHRKDIKTITAQRGEGPGKMREKDREKATKRLAK